MRKLVTTMIFSLFCCVLTNAQDFRTSYFLSNYLYDYRINPAFMGDSFKGFFSAGVGNVNVGAQASFPMDVFIYKEDGSYNFGINRDFSIEKLNKIIPTFSKANVSIDENILAIGWTRGHKAGTLEVNLRSYTSAYFDYELVRMAYNGLDELPYAIENTKASTRNWLEVAYGFNDRISDNFSFGARIKGLVGLNFSDLNIPSYHCDYDATYAGRLTASGDGTFRSSNTFLKYNSVDGLIDLRPEFGRYTIGGFGAAVDLGFKLTTSSDIEISVAVLDLGGLVWYNRIFGAISDRYCDGVEDLYTIMEAEPDSPISFVMSPVTVEAGARYPINEYLSAGSLATIRIDNTARGWYEIRIGGAYSPVKAFSVAASAAMNTLGSGLGFAFNLRIPGIAFSLGSDSIFSLFPFNSDMIPARKFNTNLHAGLSIAW